MWCRVFLFVFVSILDCSKGDVFLGKVWFRMKFRNVLVRLGLVEVVGISMVCSIIIEKFDGRMIVKVFEFGCFLV